MPKKEFVEVLGEKISPKDFSNYADECLSICQEPKNINFFDLNPNENLSSAIFTNSPHIYLNPTEVMKIGDFVHEGNDFATVLGSGDFALEAVHSKANSILCFDINKYQFPIILLKTEAMQSLSFEEYYNFFSNEKSDDFLSPKIYMKIKNNARKNSRYSYLFNFWDKIFAVREKEIVELRKDPLYNLLLKIKNNVPLETLNPQERMLFPELKQMLVNGKQNLLENFSPSQFYILAQILRIPIKSKISDLFQGTSGLNIQSQYLSNSSNYQETKNLLPNSSISYIRSDLAKLKRNIMRVKAFQNGFSGFDSMYLSNVPEYIDGKSFFEIVSEELMPLMKDNGQIVYCVQATNPEVLKSTKAELEYRKDNLSDCTKNPIFEMQEIFSTEGYQLLKEHFDISMESIDTLSQINGNGEKDLYLTIRK